VTGYREQVIGKAKIKNEKAKMLAGVTKTGTFAFAFYFCFLLFAFCFLPLLFEFCFLNFAFRIWTFLYPLPVPCQGGDPHAAGHDNRPGIALLAGSVG
jgi:hypothetical protein